MNELKIFSSPEFGEIRIVEVNNQPWFVGKDVAEKLGYAKPENAISTHVDSEDKTTTLIQGTGSNYKSNAVIINESGLYSLVLSSKLPTAKQFKRWVTSEVLPTIRKTGGYLTLEKVEEVLSNPDTIIKLATEIKNLRTENAIQKQQIAEFKPVKEYVDTILSSTDTVTVTQIAADYGLSARALNKILWEEKLIHNVNGQWILYKRWMNKGFTKSETIEVTRKDGSPKVVMNTKWTQKGRLKIHEILTAVGIVAEMDKAS